MSEWLSIAEVSQRLSVPEATLRRYIQRHLEYVQHKKIGKKYMLHPDSIKLLVLIRRLYVEENLQEEQIEEKLKVLGYTKCVTVTIEDDEMNERLLNEQSIQKQVEEALAHQEERLKNILEQQQQQFFQHFMKRTEERDKALLHMIREMQDTKKMIAATQEKKWWKFWKWFS